MGLPSYDLEQSSTCLDLYNRGQNTFGVTEYNIPITSPNTNSCRQALSREPPSKRLKRDEVTKKFRCTHGGCIKSFGKSDHLKTHIRTHTGEKPFKCSNCDKGFSDLANLKRHIRVHTGEKPFTCTHPGCGKMFSVSSNLKQHRRTHTGERPYSCTICHKTFSHVSSRRKHLACHENGGDTIVKASLSPRTFTLSNPKISYNTPVQIKTEFSSPPPIYVPPTISPTSSLSNHDFESAQFSPYVPYQFDRTVTPPSTSPLLTSISSSSPHIPSHYMVGPDMKYIPGDMSSEQYAYSQPQMFSPYMVCSPMMNTYTSHTSIYTSPTSIYTSPTSLDNSHIDTSLDDISPSITFDSTVAAFDSAIATSFALGELSACAQQKPAETFTDILVPDLRDEKTRVINMINRIGCDPLYEYVFAALALLIAEHGTIISQVPISKMLTLAKVVRSAVQIVHTTNRRG